MKTNKITKWAALLLTVSGMAAAPLSSTAAYLVVDGTAHPAESGADYQGTGYPHPALLVKSGGSYSGTNGLYTDFGWLAVTATGASRIDLYSGTVSAEGAPAVVVNGSSTLNLRDMDLESINNLGLQIDTDSMTTVRNVTVVKSGSANAYGVRVSAATLTGKGLSITTVGQHRDYGLYASQSAIIDLEDVTIQTSSAESSGILLTRSASGTIKNLNLTTTGSGASGILLEENNTAFTVIGGTIRAAAAGVASSAYLSGTGMRAILTDVDIIASTGLVLSSGESVFEMTGGSITADEALISSSYGGEHELTLNGVQTAIGSNAIIVTGATNLTVNANDTNLNGAVTGDDSSATTINLANSGITGDITGSGDSQITITGSNGANISGTVNGNDHAVIDLTVSGTGGSFIGDINQNDDAAITITLDDGATGSGAWNGGDLNIGGGGQWDFTGDSHLNNGNNSGTLNIGDHEVTFDHLTNDGTINISVNSDTGKGGSITVDIADGEGTIHIDTTGDGKEDPNKVLPDVVKGEGTENWQWDPIDWGIDTIIKDGDHFVKSGVSPAGAVLNSSVAIQQAMWFAQQNSLLKRMGELRFSSSRQLVTSSSDKSVTTISADNLIENIWLRSYGQQLNVGSQVAGQAYEQLIYGVDLGTDHKFTLSADSDLYLGVYAGYGRSDIDYRTLGTDGELNSYYGGLYATWLHSSGFYIDATFKAASVDNNLKAPYGTNQLTANYNDVNIGGSIEIGNKFTFADDWFIEPQFQVNYLHILAEDYQAGPMSITTSDLDALQLRIGSLFGRTLKLANGGTLQPYVKISGVETISSGGAIRNGYQHTRANTDGARAELGAGLIWQLDATNQLHLDYEASFGDKYDKPWGLTAGYRHQF